MELPINAFSFNLIESGVKTIETRLGNDANLKRVKAGDKLVFINREDGRRLTRTVVEVRTYATSDDVVIHEDLTALGNYASAEEYLTRMATFQSADDELKHGIIAVEFNASP